MSHPLIAMSFLARMLTPQAEWYADKNPPLVTMPALTRQAVIDALKTDYPDPYSYYLYQTVGTGSMRPTIDGGDYLVGFQTPYDELKEGDIVAYKPQWHQGSPQSKLSSLVVHRLVKKDNGGWILSGDANSRSESWERMTPDKYRHKIVKIVRDGKKAKK